MIAVHKCIVHQSGVDALVVDDGGLATPCRYSPPLVRLAVNTLTYCTARRKYNVTLTMCGNVRYCVRKQTDIFYDISVSSPGMESHHRPPSHQALFLAATHFREHKTRETLCRTQEYETHGALGLRAPKCRSSRSKHGGQVGRVLYDLDPISPHMVLMLAGWPMHRKVTLWEHLLVTPRGPLTSRESF